MSQSPFKAGFVVILGKPNAGKSTLMNALLKQKLSIVSPKPQTTRHRILGILNGDGYQICFLDTPGLIDQPKDELQHALARSARGAARQDADVAVFLTDLERPAAEDLARLSLIRGGATPVILCVNKIDQAQAGQAEEIEKIYAEALAPAASLRISALGGARVADLLAEIIQRLPDSPAFYDPDQVSDRWERFFASEIIRENIFELYREEIPHACAVVIEAFREIPGQPDDIAASLYVERPGQKGIILGKKGRDLRHLQERSRQAIAAFLGRPAELDIHVKVRANWRKDPRSIKEFGYAP